MQVFARVSEIRLKSVDALFDLLVKEKQLLNQKTINNLRDLFRGDVPRFEQLNGMISHHNIDQDWSTHFRELKMSFHQLMRSRELPYVDDLKVGLISRPEGFFHVQRRNNLLPKSESVEYITDVLKKHGDFETIKTIQNYMNSPDVIVTTYAPVDVEEKKDEKEEED
eukprot:TRINITY_DN5079_c4_g2_i1.p2 TRINITY_DN5079_c4_g2~~TRINITY_DN5079_c4_g2_i1.p2  ORF type:complete len:167 (+),score=42.39 TRINITY_DN5079_c4_g2_i1:15-515(+)